MNKAIWYISKYSSPLKYGFASRHFYLAEEFHKLNYRTIIISSNSNHLVRIPKFAARYTREMINGVETWWINTIQYRGSRSIRRILSWLDFEWKLLRMPTFSLPKPDVVIVSSLSLLTIFNGYRLKKKYGAKLVFEIRDIWPLTIVEEGPFRSNNPFVKFLAWTERYGYRKADIIVGTMPNLGGHVEAVTGTQIGCHCIPFGFKSELYDCTEPLPPGYEETYIPRGKFIVGYAGSIGRTNALETLLRCAEQMAEERTIHFLLVGDGDLAETYRRRIQSLNNITIAPKIGKTQVQTFLARCDILYFAVMNTKVWKFGQSLNKVIDYMYAGKPIIASYSGYPSMINEAGCGIFLPAEEAVALKKTIIEYAGMPGDRLREMGLRGKAWLLENRSYEKIAAAYVRLFD